MTATQTAKMTAISVRSVNAIFLRMRRKIALECEHQSPFHGELEADESYFGTKRVRGKRGRGAAGKTIVFGPLKRGHKVYTEIVPDASKATLQAIIRGKAEFRSVFHKDGRRGYDGLVDLGFDKRFRVNHGENEFAQGANHVHGIESFWSLANEDSTGSAVSPSPPSLCTSALKETEFRFNQRNNNLYKTLLRSFRKDPL